VITFRTPKALKDFDAVSLAEMLRSDFVARFPAKDVQSLNDAIQVASYLHRNDVRRGARSTSVNPPYIEHPLRVALRASRTFYCEDASALLAFVLHDTVEDHPFEFKDFVGLHFYGGQDESLARSNALAFIGQTLGYSVAKIVEGMSNPILPQGISKADKIDAYQVHVRKEVLKSSFVLLGKVSDFKDNAGSLHHHYAYGDPKVTYFLDRYEPLLDIYRHALNTGTHDFSVKSALAALDEVEHQFDRFRAAA